MYIVALNICFVYREEMTVFISEKNYVLGLLKETTNSEVKETFSNAHSIPQGVDSGKLSPSHSFQRDLVRVIGNMCYKHAANQNKVKMFFEW